MTKQDIFTCFFVAGMNDGGECGAAGLTAVWSRRGRVMAARSTAAAAPLSSQNWTQ